MSRYRQTMSEALKQVRQQFTEGHSDKDFKPYPDWKKTSGGMYPRFKHSQKGEIQVDRYGEWLHSDKSGKTIAFYRNHFPKTNTTGGTSMQLTDYLKKINEVTEQKESKQKPYISSSNGVWSVLDADGKEAYKSSNYTLAQAYFKKNFDKLKEENDHEISMARGELEAIADKATQLASALKGKSDEGNPLEAWVQSKITKAKDYINSVSDYLTYDPSMKQNEETEVNEKTYGWTLVSKAKDLAKKFKDNMTKAVDEIEKLEKGLSKNPTVDAELRKYNENLEEKYTVVITKKDGTTMELGRYNTPAEAQRYVDMYGKGAKVKKESVNEEVDLDEVKIRDIFTADKEGESIDNIAKRLKMSSSDVKKILGEETLDEKTYDEKEIDNFHTDLDKIVHKHFGHSSKEKQKMDEKVADSIIKDLQKAYADLKGKTISPQMANKISKHLDGQSYDVGTLRQLMKAQIPFISTIARNKIYKKTGKFEEINEATPGMKDDPSDKAISDKDTPKEKELKIKLDKEKDTDALEKQLIAAQGQINTLRTKLENEKNRTIKPEPNPETGEVPLTVGVAHKYIKDKKEKEMKKEQVDNYPTSDIAKHKKDVATDPKMGEKKPVHLGAKMTYEAIQGLKNKADKTGMPYSILKKVYDRGMAAWRGGHRPGASQQQWAFARVNSFVTKSSGTWGGADKDLAAKVKGSKK